MSDAAFSGPLSIAIIVDTMDIHGESYGNTHFEVGKQPRGAATA